MPVFRGIQKRAWNAGLKTNVNENLEKIVGENFTFMKLFDRISLKNKKWLLFGMLALAVILLALSLYIAQGSGQKYQVTTYSMGSYVQQTLYGPEREETAQKAANQVALLEDLISWRVENSDIQRLNAQAGKDFISLDPATQKILETSLSVCEASDGAFDITIAPLSQLWRFDDSPHLPKDALIQNLLPRIDYHNLSLLEDGTASLKESATALDLGAVGKGAACNAVLDVYRESKISRAVVAVGGSVGVYGKKLFGEPWEIALRDPNGAGSIGIFQIKSGFLSTSGSYEKTFTDETTGKTYHHILDPQTGYPADSGLVSVSVWSQDGALSDALSTACFVLGTERSLPLLEQFDAQALFITEDNQIYLTRGLEKNFRLNSPSYRLAGIL